MAGAQTVEVGMKPHGRERDPRTLGWHHNIGLAALLSLVTLTANVGIILGIQRYGLGVTGDTALTLWVAWPAGWILGFTGIGLAIWWSKRRAKHQDQGTAVTSLGWTALLCGGLAVSLLLLQFFAPWLTMGPRGLLHVVAPDAGLAVYAVSALVVGGGMLLAAISALGSWEKVWASAPLYMVQGGGVLLAWLLHGGPLATVDGDELWSQSSALWVSAIPLVFAALSIGVSYRKFGLGSRAGETDGFYGGLALTVLGLFALTVASGDLARMLLS